MATKIPVSFKRTSRDQTLYMEVMKREEHSEFIKTCIEFYVTSLEQRRNTNEAKVE